MEMLSVPVSKAYGFWDGACKGSAALKSPSCKLAFEFCSEAVCCDEE